MNTHRIPTHVIAKAAITVSAATVLVATFAIGAASGRAEVRAEAPEPAPTVTHVVPAEKDTACAEASQGLDEYARRVTESIIGPILFQGGDPADVKYKRVLAEAMEGYQSVYFDAIRRCDGLEPITFESAE